MPDQPAYNFHVPTRPYTPIDALNRRAAAVGSPGYAMGASGADYNGHRVIVSYNEYRGYYTAEFWWAGRTVIARGSFESCLQAALREYDRGALGASVVAVASDDEALAVCLGCARLIEGREGQPPSWQTWRHEAAAASVRDYAHPGMLTLRFDWELMQACEDRDEYVRALADKYERAYA